MSFRTVCAHQREMLSNILILLCIVFGVVRAVPLMYDQYDNYGARIIHPMYKPFEWREHSYPAENDYRWAYHTKDDTSGRYGKPAEYIYTNSPPMPSYGQMGTKYPWSQPDLPQPPELEPSYPLQTENIPIAILFKGPSFNLHPPEGDYGYGRNYNDDSYSHLIHRVTKPVIHEIVQEIIAPYRKGNYEEMRTASNDRTAKYLSKTPEQGPLLKNYSLIKDKNSHNFVVFNKLYDVGLQMNKANGYLLSTNHQPSQGHNQEDIDEPEHDDAGSSEESGSGKSQQA